MCCRPKAERSSVELIARKKSFGISQSVNKKLVGEDPLRIDSCYSPTTLD